MKEFLSREKVSYQEKNVAADRQAAQEMVNRTGQMGVPVTVLAGQTIIGFNQPALKAAVARLRQQQSQTQANSIRLGAQVADAGQKVGQPGALLGAVRLGSLAAQAGLREGDIITNLNGLAVASADDLARALQAVASSKVASPPVTFRRNGQEQVSRLPLHFD